MSQDAGGGGGAGLPGGPRGAGERPEEGFRAGVFAGAAPAATGHLSAASSPLPAAGCCTPGPLQRSWGGEARPGLGGGQRTGGRAGAHCSLLSDCSQPRNYLNTLSTALNILEKYGRNLLSPQRPRYWRGVKFNNPVFRSTVDAVQVKPLGP